jgi:hypothetical protein
MVIALVQVGDGKGTTAPLAMCAEVHSMEVSFMFNQMRIRMSMYNI